MYLSDKILLTLAAAMIWIFRGRRCELLFNDQDEDGGEYYDSIIETTTAVSVMILLFRCRYSRVDQIEAA